MYKSAGVAILLLSFGLVRAQDEVPEPSQEEEESGRASIVLASPTVQPGQRTYVTILLSNAPDVSMSQLEHWLEFPTSKLTYLSTRAGIAADLAGAVVKAEIQDSSEGDISILHLSVQGEKALPNGPIAEITFNVGSISPEDIVLPHRVEAFGKEGERVEEVEFGDVVLKVSHVLPDAPPAIFSCFFYMH